jgi:hypothetical protein
MSTGLTNFKFYRSFRVRADQSDKIHVKLTVTEGKQRGMIIEEKIQLIDFNLFSLSFKSKAEIAINSKINIEVYTKKFFNKWDFEVEGTVIRSFSEKSDDQYFNYGVELLNQNEDSELKYFITDYIAGFSGKKLKKFLIKSALSAREISTSDGVELFSLLNVLYKEFSDGDILELIDECKHLLQCDEVRIWTINVDNDKLENVKSSSGSHSLKDNHFSANHIGLCFSTSQCINTYNSKEKKRVQDDYELRNTLCFPLLNKDKKSIGVVEFNNKLDGNFNLQDEIMGSLLTMVLSKYFLNFVPKSKSTRITHLNPELQDDFLYFGTGQRASLIRSTLKKLKYGKTNIHIVGELGLGKEFFAKELANTAKYDIYNCNSEESIDEFFQKNHTLTKDDTVIFKNVNELSPQKQNELYNWSQFNECQFITTTCEDLSYKVEHGLFSKQLYRLFTHSLFHITPLRNRKNDIIPIANYFVRIECQKRSIDFVEIDEESIEKMNAYIWPGNITELEKVIKKSFMTRPDSKDTVTVEIPNNIESKTDEDKLLELCDTSIHPYKLFEMIASLREDDEEDKSAS